MDKVWDIIKLPPISPLPHLPMLRKGTMLSPMMSGARDLCFSTDQFCTWSLSAQGTVQPALTILLDHLVCAQLQMMIPRPLNCPCSSHDSTDSSPFLTLSPTDHSRGHTPVHCRGEEQDDWAPQDLHSILDCNVRGQSNEELSQFYQGPTALLCQMWQAEQTEQAIRLPEEHPQFKTCWIARESQHRSLVPPPQPNHLLDVLRFRLHSITLDLSNTRVHLIVVIIHHIIGNSLELLWNLRSGTRSQISSLPGGGCMHKRAWPRLMLTMWICADVIAILCRIMLEEQDKVPKVQKKTFSLQHL